MVTVSVTRQGLIFIYLCIYAFIHLLIYLFIYLSIYLFISLPNYLFIHLYSYPCNLQLGTPAAKGMQKKQHEVKFSKGSGKLSEFSLALQALDWEQCKCRSLGPFSFASPLKRGGVFPLPPRFDYPQAHLQSNNENKGNKKSKNNNNPTQDKTFNVNFMT